MDPKQKDFVRFWEKVFQNFLFPVPLCLNMASFREVHERLCDCEVKKSQREQVDILLESLLKSELKDIFNEFKEAWEKCPEQKWLYDLVFEKEKSDLSEYIHHVENIDAIKRVMHKLKPELHYIDGREFIESLNDFFSPEERGQINAILETKGNIYGLWKIFKILPCKNPVWKREMFDFVKKHGLRKTHGGQIAHALQEYFDVGFDQDENDHPTGALKSTSGGAEENATTSHHKVGHVEEVASSSQDKTEGAIPPEFVTLHGETVVPYFQAKNDEFAEHNSLAEQQEPQSEDESIANESEILNRQENLNQSENSFKSDVEESQADSETEEVNEPSNESDFQLRGYQKVLVNAALQENNCILCAPPGSGKTLIAGHIILRLLEKYPGCRVLFFAPSVALVNQQKLRLTQYFNGKYEVGCVHGRSENESDLRIGRLQVICLTPKILLNNLLTKSHAEDEELKISITDFKCFIFDECHHCRDKSLYGSLMQQYANLKNSKEECDLPLVIGLTATLGVGSSTEMTKVKENIKLLCANMDAYGGIYTINTKHDVQELHQFIAHPDEEIIKLEERKNDQFSSCLDKFVNSLLYMLEQFGVFKFFKSSLRNCSMNEFQDMSKSSFQFRGRCNALRKCIETSQIQMRREAMSCMEYLEICQRTASFYYHCPASDALGVLTGFLKEISERSAEDKNDTEAELFESLQAKIAELERLTLKFGRNNQHLIEIQDKILKTFASQPNSRIMVLVSERSFTEAIQKWMNNNEKLKSFNAELFVGVVNAKRDALKMGPEKQQKILNAFREGKHKILVCTIGAAGEGLDVVDCNLVITYNCEHNEITLVQTRGRVRKQGGVMVKMFNSHSSLLRDRLNAFKEILMKKATAEVQKDILEDRENYLIEIRKKQHESNLNFQIWCAKWMRESAIKQNAKEYHLHCRKCLKFACSTLDVKRLSGGQVINMEKCFGEKYTSRDHPRKKFMGPGWEKKSKIQCKKCGNDWGLKAEWKSLLIFPFPKMVSFSIVDPDDKNQILSPKTWNKANFYIPEVDLEDLVKMLNKEEQ